MQKALHGENLCPLLSCSSQQIAWFNLGQSEQDKKNSSTGSNEEGCKEMSRAPREAHQDAYGVECIGKESSWKATSMAF